MVEWVRAHGSPGWASECAASFARQPVACFVAVDGAQGKTADHLAGIACYEASARGFFGPELVHPERRGKGIASGQRGSNGQRRRGTILGIGLQAVQDGAFDQRVHVAHQC